ncbi:hypothetical protein KIW84_075355 [Lathyrus oleraceus]|uniref:Uncharacterized protein n=1 Tax=Pisum sativum TaxID=3888 RepID=A0A9D4VV34_PEA|nr:hypothetical protein KIW84_075355 [Pisum sativum]
MLVSGHTRMALGNTRMRWLHTRMEVGNTRMAWSGFGQYAYGHRQYAYGQDCDFLIEMAGRGRDDAAIAEALGMLAGVLGGNPNVMGMGAARQLSEFQKNNPPMFKGAYDPDGAQKCLKEIERIFRVTECADN